MGRADWFSLNADRKPFFTVYFGGGHRMMLPYSGVQSLLLTPQGSMTITCGAYKVEGTYIEPGRRRNFNAVSMAYAPPPGPVIDVAVESTSVDLGDGPPDFDGPLDFDGPPGEMFALAPVAGEASGPPDAAGPLDDFGEPPAARPGGKGRREPRPTWMTR